MPELATPSRPYSSDVFILLSSARVHLHLSLGPSSRFLLPLYEGMCLKPIESKGTFVFKLSRGETPWMQLFVQRRGLHSMADMILGRRDHVPAFVMSPLHTGPCVQLVKR